MKPREDGGGGDYREPFLEICRSCSAVLCCRMAPLQKAQVSRAPSPSPCAKPGEAPPSELKAQRAETPRVGWDAARGRPGRTYRGVPFLRLRGSDGVRVCSHTPAAGAATGRREPLQGGARVSAVPERAGALRHRESG